VTVELKPETERLVQEEILRGRFQSVDEVIVQGVYALREKSTGALPAAPPRKPRKNLADFLAESPFAGSEIDLERQLDDDRPLDL
jgi:Arc/MetJ-type ribon-helix-helix transcriptional regulator